MTQLVRLLLDVRPFHLVLVLISIFPHDWLYEVNDECEEENTIVFDCERHVFCTSMLDPPVCSRPSQRVAAGVHNK